MKPELHEETVVKLVVEELDNRVKGLDPVTAARVSAVRHRALQRKGAEGLFSPLGRRLALGGAGALVALVLALPFWRGGEPAPTLTAQEAEAIDILTTQGQVDLSDEDPEFFRWLAEQKQNAG
jgi:hypothetical protein